MSASRTFWSIRKWSASKTPSAIQLAQPQRVIQSLSDPEARLYYRYYVGTRVGDKFLCVVVKVVGADAFVLTAYLADTIKKGQQLWPPKA